MICPNGAVRFADKCFYRPLLKLCILTSITSNYTLAYLIITGNPFLNGAPIAGRIASGRD